jgi:hypothetical protein
MMTTLIIIGASIHGITTMAQTNIMIITCRNTIDGITIGIMRRTTTVQEGTEAERCRRRGGLQECPSPLGATPEAGRPSAGGRACPQVLFLKVLPVVLCVLTQ